ncbi:hypothetical protein H0H87_011949, partial [Tephrocybe sp. NHM501043]
TLDVDDMHESIQSTLSKTIQSQIAKKITDAVAIWTTIAHPSSLAQRSAQPAGHFTPCHLDAQPPSVDINTQPAELAQRLSPTSTSGSAPCCHNIQGPPLYARSASSNTETLPVPSEPSHPPLPHPSPPSPPPSPLCPSSSTPSVKLDPMLSDPPLYSPPASRTANHKKCRPQTSEQFTMTSDVTSSVVTCAQNVQTDNESELPQFVVPSIPAPHQIEVPSNSRAFSQGVTKEGTGIELEATAEDPACTLENVQSSTGSSTVSEEHQQTEEWVINQP